MKKTKVPLSLTKTKVPRPLDEPGEGVIDWIHWPGPTRRGCAPLTLPLKDSPEMPPDADHKWRLFAQVEISSDAAPVQRMWWVACAGPCLVRNQECKLRHQMWRLSNKHLITGIRCGCSPAQKEGAI